MCGETSSHSDSMGFPQLKHLNKYNKMNRFSFVLQPHVKWFQHSKVWLAPKMTRNLDFNELDFKHGFHRVRKSHLASKVYTQTFTVFLKLCCQSKYQTEETNISQKITVIFGWLLEFSHSDYMTAFPKLPCKYIPE